MGQRLRYYVSHRLIRKTGGGAIPAVPAEAWTVSSRAPSPAAERPAPRIVAGPGDRLSIEDGHAVHADRDWPIRRPRAEHPALGVGGIVAWMHPQHVTVGAGCPGDGRVDRARVDARASSVPGDAGDDVEAAGVPQVNDEERKDQTGAEGRDEVGAQHPPSDRLPIASLPG